MQLDRHDQNGFTLLEMVIAISIFTVGVLAASAIASHVIKSNRMSKNFTTAVNLAENKIDDLKIIAYAALADSSESGLDAAAVAGAGIFDRTVTVTESFTPDYKTITATVAWPDPYTRRIVLSTIIAK